MGGQQTCKVGGAYEVRREWEIMGKWVNFIMGSERRVRFCGDRWCMDEPLRDVFPSLFAIAVSKEAWVKGVWFYCGKMLGT